MVVPMTAWWKGHFRRGRMADMILMRGKKAAGGRAELFVGRVRVYSISWQR